MNSPPAPVHHRVGDDPVEAEAGGVEIDTEGLSDLGDQRRLGGGSVEAHAPTEEVVGVDESEAESHVGDGGLGAAAAVAGRTGVGACRPGTDARRAPGVDPAHRAPAGANGGDVDHRQAGVESAQTGPVGEC